MKYFLLHLSTVIKRSPQQLFCEKDRFFLFLLAWFVQEAPEK